MATTPVGSIGTTFDFTDIINKFSDLEKSRLDPITAAQQATQTKLSSYGTLSDAVSSVRDAAAALSKANSNVANKVTGDTFTVTTDSTATTGTYQVEVENLATNQSLKSGSVSSRTASNGNGGSIEIKLVSGKTVNIDVSADNSLNGIAKAVNASASGVKANVVSDGQGNNYLLFSASDSGTQGSAASITVTGNATLQATIGYTSSDPTGSATKVQTAAVDAKFKLNNIEITSASNTVTGVLDGVTFNLVKPAATPGVADSLNLATDPAAVLTAAKAFASAYNALQATVGALTTYDATTQTASALTGDGTTRSAQTGLANAFQSATGTGTMKGLSQLGFATDPKTGQLSIDETAFNKAMAADPEGVSSLLSGPNGVGATFAAATTTILGDGKANKGTIGNSLDTLNTLVKTQAAQATDMQASIGKNIDILNAQFLNLGTVLSQIENTQNYLTAQFAPKSS
jgi:flagellar hook-associated protein 2